MKGVRVYISKSNSCRIDDLIEVRSKLLDLGFKIIEHAGGAYNRQTKHRAHILIAIGHAESHKNTFKGGLQPIFQVGKGVFTEIMDFKGPRYIFKKGYLLELKPDQDYKITDVNWQFNFAKFNTLPMIRYTFAELKREHANKGREKKSPFEELITSDEPVNTGLKSLENRSLKSWFKRK